MDYGVLINKHSELLQLDGNYDIYISRKALKHFVESRKKEMVYSHTKEEVLDKLYFAVDMVKSSYINPDMININHLGRPIYTKYLEKIKKTNIRIVFELKNERLEICSIHFQKHK